MSLLNEMHAMFKIVVAFGAVLAAMHVVANEEVLWWMVGDPSAPYGDLSGITVTKLDGETVPATGYEVNGMSLDQARIRVAGTDEYLTLVSIEDSSVVDIGTAGDVPDEFFAAVVPYNSIEYSFLIELGNYDYDTGTWTILAVSETVSYDTLKNVRHNIAEWSVNEQPTPIGGAWAPTAYTVPEPSGGLLFLVGGGLLALRRRRRKKFLENSAQEQGIVVEYAPKFFDVKGKC